MAQTPQIPGTLEDLYVAAETTPRLRTYIRGREGSTYSHTYNIIYKAL